MVETDNMTLNEGQPLLAVHEMDTIVDAWLGSWAAACCAADSGRTSELFASDAWWRDILSLTWDLRTFHGHESIADLLGRLDGGAISEVRPHDRFGVQFQSVPDRPWIEGFFEFETAEGSGVGVVRLVDDGDGWRAWTLLTALDRLHDVAPALGGERPIGHAPYGNPAHTDHWAAAREVTADFAERDPEVIIVGAGQGGLSLAANLGLLGVATLVVEKNDRVGDNWRQRYDSLVLHDPVWADHLPYLPFPPNWPVYTPKDKLGDWFEFYASAMELNVWTNTRVTASEFDEGTGRWSVRVNRAGEERSLQADHVVLATGALGEPSVPPIGGLDDFVGEVYHSSAHNDGGKYAGRSAVVVGACNSGHDIAQNLHEAGADTTIVQRSSTYIMSQKHGIPTIFGALYFEGGPPLEQADLLNASFPPGLNIEFAKTQTPAIAILDRDLLDGLEAVGFKLDYGVDGGGLMSKALRRGGGYYIDVGCSTLIAEGKIKVAQGSGVRRLVKDGVELEDGRILPADLVVLATGYQNMRETARKIFGDAVANRCGLVWDLDDEGELNTIWRQSGHPHFWFMGGPLVMARIFSKYLALQIKADLLGIRGGTK